jgi:FlaA1/EpsC-like NDP-sugar epimerase
MMINNLSNLMVHGFSYIYRSLSRSFKRQILRIIDVFLCILAIYLAFILRFNYQGFSQHLHQYYWQIVVLLLVKLIIFNLRGIYRPILRYAGLELLNNASLSVFYSSGILIILAYLQGTSALPRTVLIIDALLTLLLIISSRLIIRNVTYSFINNIPTNKRKKENILIYGAGAAGRQLALALSQDPNYRLIAFVDDDAELHNNLVSGYKVYNPLDLANITKIYRVYTILLAIPSAEKSRKREILETLLPLSVSVKTIPSLGEIVAGKVSINQIRNIDVVDLLGREEIQPDPQLLTKNITGKSVFVTGAGGSIGSQLCRQIAQLNPRCLILYELSEFSLYQIDLELTEYFPNITKFAYLGNVTDEITLESILKKHQVDTIYHAAAYKHVPLVESNPCQGVYNNIAGTLVAARSAINAGVNTFVLISTDKAVRPTNVMGASKRVAELVIQALAMQFNHQTCFSMVRFGNVLDSSGSVVPRFRQQIAEGKPITVTHPEITRYFMSIPEAVRLVIQAGAISKGGEVFLLDMGDPIKIYDLAKDIIRLSGLELGKDININITGLRQGEKLYEELLINGDNIKPTQHPKIFSAYEQQIDWQDLNPILDRLLANARINQQDSVLVLLQKIVPEYQPQKTIINPKI